MVRGKDKEKKSRERDAEAKRRSEKDKKRDKDKEWNQKMKDENKREKDRQFKEKEKSRKITSEPKKSQKVPSQKEKIKDFNAFLDSLDSDTVKKSSKKPKSKKSFNALTEDDGKCEMCGHMFQETEMFMKHIETDHDHLCLEAGCELSFTHEYFLHLHEAEVHKTRQPPDISQRPEEEKTRSPKSSLIVTSKSANEFSSVLESIVDLSSSTIDDSLNSSPAQFKCDDCSATFSTSRELYVHTTDSHYTFEQASSSQAYLPSIKCTFPQCPELFENTEKLKKHYVRVHEVKKEKVHRGYHIRCPLCRKTLSSQNKLHEHQKIEHKHKCEKCPRAYVLLPDLLHHVLKDHDKIESDTFSCRLCDQKFSDKQTWRKHEASPHEHSCTQEECYRMFSDRRQLEIHLSQEHNVLYVTIDHSLGTKGVITTKKSAASEDIEGWAEEWIR